MKFHRLAFLAAVLLTFVMVVVAFIFDYSKENLTNTHFFAPLIISVLLMVLINYFVVDFLFNFFTPLRGKRHYAACSFSFLSLICERQVTKPLAGPESTVTRPRIGPARVPTSWERSCSLDGRFARAKT